MNETLEQPIGRIPEGLLCFVPRKRSIKVVIMSTNIHVHSVQHIQYYYVVHAKYVAKLSEKLASMG